MTAQEAVHAGLVLTAEGAAAGCCALQTAHAVAQSLDGREMPVQVYHAVNLVEQVAQHLDQGGCRASELEADGHAVAEMQQVLTVLQAHQFAYAALVHDAQHAAEHAAELSATEHPYQPQIAGSAAEQGTDQH